MMKDILRKALKCWNLLKNSLIPQLSAWQGTLKRLLRNLRNIFHD
jgi:hypothetical protein